MDQIIEEIKGNKTTKLDLWRKFKNLSDLEKNSILERICDALKTNSTINEINLSDNQINDIGVKYISDILKINSTISQTLFK